MRHEGNSYYVGLLKAAELHGATHQAVMEFQVVAAKRLPRSGPVATASSSTTERIWRPSPRALSTRKPRQVR
nr:type IV toxin-antitoxin system AbiEi family antitoxin [Rhizobium ruizarguesonis]